MGYKIEEVFVGVTAWATWSPKKTLKETMSYVEKHRQNRDTHIVIGKKFERDANGDMHILDPVAVWLPFCGWKMLKD